MASEHAGRPPKPRCWPRTARAITNPLQANTGLQYFAKNPHGYRSHSATGVPFPKNV